MLCSAEGIGMCPGGGKADSNRVHTSECLVRVMEMGCTTNCLILLRNRTKHVFPSLTCVFVEDETDDLWADLSSLSFDKWKADAMINGKTCKHNGKRSYEMMMAIFGQRSHHHGSKAGPTPATATAHAKKQHPIFAQSSYHHKSKATVNHPNDQNPNGKLSRSSRLMKLGEVLKNRLLNSGWHHLKRRLTKKANEEMLCTCHQRVQ